MKIALVPVKLNQRETLFRLLQYSLYEESLTDLNEMNEEALFDYPYFDAYFAEDEREAFFIRECSTEKLLGFAMVRAHDRRHSVAEFMVLPKYRRQRIGTQAAKVCFALHDGTWEVKPAYGSLQAKRFWQHVISTITDTYEWKTDRYFFKTQKEKHP